MYAASLKIDIIMCADSHVSTVIAHQIDRKRYTGTQPRLAPQKPCDLLIEALDTWSDADFKEDFRCSRKQFAGLVLLIQDHEVFNPDRPRRPQRPVRVQLAIALYRFGSFGNKSGPKAVAKRFRLSGKLRVMCTKTLF